MIIIFAKLLLIFIVVPVVELAILIEIGSRIGLLPTLLLIGATGIVGATLARNQGMIVYTKIREKLSGGQIPAHNLIEGLLILIGGITLLTPGVLTDIIGFLLIIPFSRPFFVKLAKNIFQRYINKNQFKTNGNFSSHSDFSRKDDYVDVEYEEEEEPVDK